MMDISTVVQVRFSYKELSRKARANARERFFSASDYNWATEALASLNALAKHFDGRVSNYEIDWRGNSHSHAEFRMPDYYTEADIRAKLKELGKFNPRTLRGTGECKLTGYCTDESAIDGFRKEFYAQAKAERDAARKALPAWALEDVEGKAEKPEPRSWDLESLMQGAFKTWLKNCQDDAKYQYSDEGFSETCEANKYEFDAEGRLI